MPTLTQQQVEELKRKGLNDARIAELAAKKGYSLPEQSTNFAQDVRSSFDTRARNVIDATNRNVSRFNAAGTDALSTFVEKPALIGQTLGEYGKEATLGAGDIGFAAIKSVGKATGLDKPVGQAIEGVLSAATKDPVVGPGIRIMTDFYNSLDPDSRRAVDQTFAIASLGGAGRAGTAASNAAREFAPLVKADLASLAQTAPKASRVSELYQKAVKPSVAGISSSAKSSMRQAQADLAIKTIVDNKRLSFMDDGDIVASSRLPKNLQEFSEAIGQTKRQVFEQYDSLAKNAENKISVELSPVATELETVAQNKVLADLAPEVAAYARNRADSLLRRGSYSTVEAQDAIEQLNKSLQAFYRNPSYDTASKAAIDALIANNLRKSLDEAIESISGAQYQSLKLRYGALKSIEADVTKAALRDARKNFAGLIDYTDIFSGGQVLSGVMTLNPTLVASGAFQKAIQTLIKRLNDPNRQIEELFKEAAKVSDILPTSASQI